MKLQLSPTTAAIIVRLLLKNTTYLFLVSLITATALIIFGKPWHYAVLLPVGTATLPAAAALITINLVPPPEETHTNEQPPRLPPGTNGPY